QPQRVGVPFEVVHRDDGQSACERQPLRHVDAYHERPGQSRPARHRDGVEVVERDPGAVERLLDDRVDALDVRARGDLREDTAELRVDIHLRGDYIGEDAPPILNDGGARLIAGAFNRQNQCHYGKPLSIHSFTVRAILPTI